ncbi:MAG: DUF177 domain-containing protein [Chloroflexota bacterium]
MTPQPVKYLPPRVLKLNVGFLLDGQSISKDMDMDLPAVRVAEDLTLDFVQGTLRASRTREGILIQGNLDVGVQGDCFRCLNPVQRPIKIRMEELYASTNEMSEDEAEFQIHDDGQLDLAPLIRAEVLIQTTRGIRCEDVEACDERMRTLEDEAGIDHIDPRMEKLKQLLEQQNDQS